MGRLLAAVAVVLALGPAATAGAQQPVPEPRGMVTDLAAFLEPGERQELEDLLRRYREGEGHEVAVLTVPELGGEPIEDFAIRVARSWGLGRQGEDDGVLLVVARAERRIRIEVGDELEGTLTDLLAGRIIDQLMVPEFRAGRPAAGIRRGVEGVLAVLGGNPAAIPAGPERRPRGGGMIVFQVLFTLLLLLLLLAGSRRTRVGADMS